MRIVSSRAAAAVAAAVLALVAIGPLAWARTQDRIVVKKGPAVVREYPALPPNDPLLEDTIQPGNCMTLPGCDTIPLTIVPPTGLSSNQDFFVVITLSWDTTLNSNLQLYIWDDPPQTDPPTPQRVVAQSSGESEPERVLLYRPTDGTYFIVVSNVAGTAPGNVPSPGGANTGYTLRLEMTFRSYDSPFELLEPPPPGTTAAPATSTPGAEVPAGPGTITPTPFALASQRPDPSFGELVGRPSALDALRPQAGQLAARPTVARPPPGPVNGFLFALWAGIVPVGVVGAGALVLRRRAAASLDLD
jgi:hypothetical protein